RRRQGINRALNTTMLQPVITRPRKSDVHLGFTERGAIASELKVDEKTIYRWDTFLTIHCQPYRADRLGSRMPLTGYQRWCLKQLKRLFQPSGSKRSRPQKAVLALIKSNPYLLSYEAYQNENLRIG
ncbi:MAG: hypothetical protein ACM37W_20890, partial [Actinomycetota bacterium]